MKKVVLLGGLGTGKTTIISSIFSQLHKQMPAKVCTVMDYTDYLTSNSADTPPTSLREIQTVLLSYLTNGRNVNFIVDSNPTCRISSYICEFNSGNSSLDLEFVDVPGNFMDERFHTFSRCKELIDKSDVVVIAIDTPYLMNAVDDECMAAVNEVRNRVSEITNCLYNVNVSSPDKMKQIIFCPVKCEKWILNGEAEKVTDNVKSIYGKLIENLKKIPLIDIWIMPIQTVGGIQFSRHLPAMIAFEDDPYRCGIIGSIDPITDSFIDSKGNVFLKEDFFSIEKDKSYEVDYVQIPRSWYKLNGLGYSPRFGELIGYHILEFLVQKEARVVAAKGPTPFGFLKKASFDLHVWVNVIDQLKLLGCMKDEDNVFFHVGI